MMYQVFSPDLTISSSHKFTIFKSMILSC
jgi:hypothetical protein